MMFNSLDQLASSIAALDHSKSKYARRLSKRRDNETIVRRRKSACGSRPLRTGADNKKNFSGGPDVDRPVRSLILNEKVESEVLSEMVDREGRQILADGIDVKNVPGSERIDEDKKSRMELLSQREVSETVFGGIRRL